MKPALLIMLIISFFGCAVQKSVYIKDEKEYGLTSGLFRERWWHYYERGLSYIEGEFFEDAIRDFQSAIEQRRDDHWRSRTYGMHLINYFPHRELGVIYYILKRYHEAEEELEDSLKTAESAKAKYYLNKTRKAILRETGADKLFPTIKIIHPTDGMITNEFSVTLDSEVEDDYYIASVSINLIPLPLELSAKKVLLKEKLHLERGMNEIKIRTSDLTDKTTEKVLKIMVDTEGPIIIIEDQKVIDQRLILSGFLTDNIGIDSFMINGKKIPIIYEQDPNQSSHVLGQVAEFHQEIDMSEITDSIILEVKDVSNNVTKGELYIGPSSARINGLVLLASSHPIAPRFSLNQYAFLGNGLGRIIDNTPPEIQVEDLEEVQIVYTDLIYLEGCISDNIRIKSCRINGESILKRKGKKVFFNYLTKLKKGENRFFIEATDIFGNRSQKTLMVYRKIPKIRQIDSRMSLFVLPLDSQGKQSFLGDVIYDRLIAAFVNQGRFHLIERERMEEVLSELRLSQTELADPGTAMKIGKIVVADAILIGAIYESKNQIEILTRLVDTETASVMAAKDVFDEDKSMSGIERLVDGLALKYRQSFPVLEGVVMKKKGKIVVTDLGEDKRIKRNMRLILFRDGEEILHPSTGRVFGTEPVELGEAKVENVYNGYSKAIIRKGKPDRIKIEDRVMTK